MTTNTRKAWTDTHKELGPLHDLLVKATVPDGQTRKKSITVLAKSMSLTPWAIYLWIKRNRIPPLRAKQIVAKYERYAEKANLPAKERVSLREFDEYVYV